MKGLTMDDHKAALAEGQLIVAVCGSCRRQQAIPASTCFACGSDDLRVSRHSGSGRLLSWIVTHVAFSPELEAEIPYTVVLTDLDGGGRVYGRLEVAQGSKIEIRADMPVALDTELTRKRGYPVYRPVAES